MSEKNNPVRSDILFDFYEHVSSMWACLYLLLCNAAHPVSGAQNLIFYTMRFYFKPNFTYIFAKGHRYMIFKSNRSVAFCPGVDNVCYEYK